MVQSCGMNVVVTSCGALRSASRAKASAALRISAKPADPFGETMHHAWSLTKRANDALSDAQVVVGQVKLGLPAGREVDTVRIGDPHQAVTHLQLDCWGRAALGRHHHKLASRGRALQCRWFSTPHLYDNFIKCLSWRMMKRVSVPRRVTCDVRADLHTQG